MITLHCIMQLGYIAFCLTSFFLAYVICARKQRRRKPALPARNLIASARRYSQRFSERLPPFPNIGSFELSKRNKDLDFPPPPRGCAQNLPPPLGPYGPTKQRTDERTDQPNDQPTNGPRTNGPTDQWTNGPTDQLTELIIELCVRNLKQAHEIEN